MIQLKNIIIWVTLCLFLFVRPLIAEKEDGFLTVSGPCNLEFPQDHGAHPGYRTEWWYYTGNLRSESGNHYGFQLTFFRSQMSPPDSEKEWPQYPSRWRTQQIYLGHAAIADITRQRHFQAEMVSREPLGLAGVSIRDSTVVVHLNNWSAQISPSAHALRADTDEFSFDLALTPEKRLVMHGQRGYSLKGSTPDRASCYYSFTRLAVEGDLSVFGQNIRVGGSAWMDHEYSTAFLEPGLKGWDWFSLQLSDQSEIMAFLLRTESGKVHPASSATIVEPSGRTQHLDRDDFDVIVLDTWRTPRSNGRYPARWRLRIGSFLTDLVIISNLADLEMHTPNTTASPTGREVWQSAALKMAGRSRARDTWN